MTNFFQRLVTETTKEREKLYLVPQIQDGLKGEISLETYIAYLTQAYHHVKYTTPLLMAVGSRISHQQEWLRDAVAHYIEEELGHQEWILRDIKNCGADEQKVRNGEPELATEIMVSYAFDSVMRKNPLSFFGMVFVLEGTSTQLATHAAKKIMEKLNLKENCFSYLLSHGSVDIKHMKFFEDLVNKITDEKDQQAIIHMAKVMFQLFANVFLSIPHEKSKK